MKYIITFFMTLGAPVFAFAHNGVEHGPSEHYIYFHFAHYGLLFGGIAICIYLIIRDHKELFGKK